MLNTLVKGLNNHLLFANYKQTERRSALLVSAVSSSGGRLSSPCAVQCTPDHPRLRYIKANQALHSSHTSQHIRLLPVCTYSLMIQESTSQRPSPGIVWSTFCSPPPPPPPFFIQVWPFVQYEYSLIERDWLANSIRSPCKDCF